MAYTYYDSKTDGTIDTEIQSGVTGNLFSSVTVAERISGDDEFKKMWISSDSDLTAYIGINSYTAYGQNIFLSANEADAVGDLTGSETRYGALKVVSATASAIKVTEDEFYTLARVGDIFVVESAPYEIATITDNGDGTIDIVATIDYVALPPADAFVTTMFTLSLTTAVAKPFWCERKITAGASWSGGNVVVDLKIGN